MSRGLRPECVPQAERSIASGRGRGTGRQGGERGFILQASKTPGQQRLQWLCHCWSGIWGLGAYSTTEACFPGLLSKT